MIGMFAEIGMFASVSVLGSCLLKIKYLILSLRMPFGGSPCPSEFSLLTDIVTDTINDLLNDKNWNNKKIYSKAVHDIPDPVRLSDDIPYAQARSLSVDLPVEENGKSDVFIDDIITCAVDIEDNLDRITKAPITIIEATARHELSSDVQKGPNG